MSSDVDLSPPPPDPTYEVDEDGHFYDPYHHLRHPDFDSLRPFLNDPTICTRMADDEFYMRVDRGFPLVVRRPASCFFYSFV